MSINEVLKCLSWLHNELQVAMVGHEVDLSFSYDHLGESTLGLVAIAAQM